MRFATLCLLLALIALAMAPACAQVTISGRAWMPRTPGSDQMVPFKAIYVFGSPAGSDSQACAGRTWEMDPTGWYHLTGAAGNYTIAYSTPGKAMRPIIRTNVFTQPGETFDIHVAPSLDYVAFADAAWDTKAAKEYYQPFVARGASITSVGFKLVHDGVDGQDPGSQNVLLSIHRKGKSTGTPDTWEQVGPAVVVLDVDCGGAKGYDFSAGWDSGEVPTVPGETYAVRLRPEAPTGHFQTFWEPCEDKAGQVYRVAEGAAGFQPHRIWMTVSSDSDGLVIPYNKRVHREFVGQTKFARKWTQTYVAQGRGLASVVLYTMTSGVQPGIPRQRVAVRVRRGGPDGPLVGIEKIAIGAGNFTGDASWGVFGAAFAPGEVSLVPGQTYAIEFESAESIETLHGYVNIKNMPSDDKPGFHPYPKIAPDTYKRGRAYLNGSQATDFDLDMQVVEYVSPVENWSASIDQKNLLGSGWKQFTVDSDTILQEITDPNQPDNQIMRVVGGNPTGKTADGGWVQKIDGLKRADTYRVSGKVRSTWLADEHHQCLVGIDPTGQIDDPNAATISWTVLPGIHGLWAPYAGGPVRPAKDAVSIWLRAKTSLTVDFPFRADFDDFSVQRVKTEVPR